MFRKNSMYIIYSETDHQPRLDAWDKCLGLVNWEDPEESGGEGGGEGVSGWGIHVTPWLIHVSVWQNPLKCCEVISLQLIKINEKKKNNKEQISLMNIDVKIISKATWIYKEDDTSWPNWKLD